MTGENDYSLTADAEGYVCNFDHVRVHLPGSFEEQMKADGIREYEAQQEQKWFGVVRWCDDDIREILQERGIDPLDACVDAVRSRCRTHHFTDAMIEAGREVLASVIDAVLFEEVKQ